MSARQALKEAKQARKALKGKVVKTKRAGKANAQARVQTLPRIITVTCFCDQHSPIFGHDASSQTVLSFSERTSSFDSTYSRLSGARTRNQSGLRPEGRSGFRCFSGCRGLTATVGLSVTLGALSLVQSGDTSGTQARTRQASRAIRPRSRKLGRASLAGAIAPRSFERAALFLRIFLTVQQNNLVRPHQIQREPRLFVEQIGI